jgi:NADPH2:quinone reductase
MRALVSHLAGGPETLVLEDIPAPQPASGEVLIQVAAAAINYPDALIIEDRYQYKPQRPFTPGAEVAGIVEAVGEGVSDFRRGMRVMSMVGHGGLAEKVCAPAKETFEVPDGLSLEVASAVLMTYGTTFHALTERASLTAGETLLVLGAAGGTGLAAIELGKSLGARVVAATSSDEKAAIARKAGADVTMVYPRPPFAPDQKKALAQMFKEAVGPGGADVIYDPVGGEYAEPALRAIAPGGRYLVVGFTAGVASIPMNLILLKACQLIGVFWGADIERRPAAFRAQIGRLLELCGSGAIRPFVSEIFSLECAPDAIRKISERSAMGKLVVRVNQGLR